MIATIPVTQPFGTAIRQKARWLMDVILHIGAHRCATTSFQHYMRSNRAVLTASGIGFWGPLRTRSGLFRGIQPGPEIRLGRDVKRRALGRVRLRCAQSEEMGLRKLIVSDENMIGSMRANLRLADLYTGAGGRMARFAEAFDGYVTDVALNVRSPELYWASMFGFFAEHGRGLPRAGLLSRIAASPRSWRDVIEEIARAMPRARVHVLPFERFAGRADQQLCLLSDTAVPAVTDDACHNKTPDLDALRQIVAPGEGTLPGGSGRWMPFSKTQRAEMRERYADDLMWLAGGADGLAELAQIPAQSEAETHLPKPELTKGSDNDSRHRQVARAGRERAAWKAG